METKQSKIELLIDEIQDYIDSCKYKAFSNNIIMVNKDEMDSYLMELKKNTPEEIKHYQKIIANRNAIMAEADKARNDAKLEAQEIVNKAITQTNELISEHEIMQRAYDQANEVINLAASQAQEIVDAAVIEANELKESATQYTDSLLAHVEEVTSHYINQSDNEYNRLISSLNECVETVRANRNELYPQAASEAGATTDYIPLQNTAPVKSDSIVDLDLI
ncbi:MAG: vacuolar family H+-ATPase subunit H [Lachnospiraceae bacterium]|nr:vacuolar family H+-ATPase subunit H [Lachnospiraceae bacterium]MCR4865652.1 vacuolar family H+-ATPase subunit H [Lachnospiraceae bacterium]